jgi:hypothetical protein
MHQQQCGIRNHPIAPLKTESYRRANLHALHRVESSVGTDQERMHSMGANAREIPISSLKDGELFQGIHSGIYRTQQEYRSW